MGSKPIFQNLKKKLKHIGISYLIESSKKRTTSNERNYGKFARYETAKGR